MPRRNSRLVTRRPPRYKWCGHNESYIVQTHVATALADIMLPCPSLGNSDIQGQCTIERVLMYMTTNRQNVSEVDACAFLLAMQRTTPATGLPIDVLNPLDVTADNFTLGLKDLIMFGQLSWPPIVLQADDTVAPNRQGISHFFEFNGRRTLDRLNHALTLTIVSDLTDQIRIFVGMRVLLRMT